jgi:hypothetical protein
MRSLHINSFAILILSLPSSSLPQAGMGANKEQMACEGGFG